jgi:hypothetical protein
MRSTKSHEATRRNSFRADSCDFVDRFISLEGAELVVLKTPKRQPEGSRLPFWLLQSGEGELVRIFSPPDAGESSNRSVNHGYDLDPFKAASCHVTLRRS